MSMNLNCPKGVLLARIVVNNGNKVISNVELLVAAMRVVREGGKEGGHMEYHCT